MLQQTQVDRVRQKYVEFLHAFPTFSALSKAQLPEVLRVWQGLGYNRRALALKRSADEVMTRYKGRLPRTLSELKTLPGIGPYTAGAIMAFAFNKPAVIIETNIRSVYIHEFFPKSEQVSDRELLPLIEQTLDQKNPRTWYFALMDYGAHLKKTRVNPSRNSTGYKKQSSFAGSNRQVRGTILKLLTQHAALSEKSLVRLSEFSKDRVQQNLIALQREGFLKKKNNTFLLCLSLSK